MDQPLLTPPILDQIADDLVVRSASRASVLVYVILRRRLDYGEFRPCKVAALAYDLGMKPHTVSRIMGALAKRGYLDRRYVKHHGYEYRLLYSRRAPEMPPNGTSRGAA